MPIFMDRHALEIQNLNRAFVKSGLKTYRLLT